MIPGEQQTFFLEQETDVIRSMTRRVDCAQPNGMGRLYSTGSGSSVGATLGMSTGAVPVVEREDAIVRGLYGWKTGHVLQTIRRRRQADDRRAGGLRESVRTTRVIPMRVSDENEPESRNGSTQQRNVRTIVRSRVEHRDGWVSQNVAVRAGPCHERSIWRDKTLHRS